MQGSPGAGKTTTGKKIEDVTGLRVLYCGTSGIASADFKSKAIKSYIALGMNVEHIDIPKEITSANVLSKIVQLISFAVGC